MIALQITSMKNFMNHLLVADTFDPFLLEEATVSTALTVTIDGHINKDFYPAEERSADCIPWELQSWSKIKGLCFDLIKGKHTPLYFKFVLHMQPDKAARKKPTKCRMRHIRQTGCGNVYLEGRPTGRTFCPVIAPATGAFSP